MKGGLFKRKVMILLFKIYVKFGKVQWYIGFVEKIIKCLEKEGMISKRDCMGLFVQVSQVVKDKIGIYINIEDYEVLQFKKYMIWVLWKKCQIKVGDNLYLIIFNCFLLWL